MMIRIVLGGVLILALAGVFWLDRVCGGGWIFCGLAALAAVWGLAEVFRLLPSLAPGTRCLCCIGALGMVVAARAPAWAPQDLHLLVLVLVPAMVAVAALRRQSPAAGVEETGAGIFALIYLGLFPSVLVLIRQGPDGWSLVLAILVATKAADIGAYFTGRCLGRHKLAPRLSPNKTVEGLLGGLAFSACAAWILLDPVLAVPGFTPTLSLIFGGVLGAAGTLGDLVESLLKRSRGVKDSGALLPGFGGILDIIDSPLLSAPAALAMVEIIR